MANIVNILTQGIKLYADKIGLPVDEAKKIFSSNLAKKGSDFFSNIFEGGLENAGVIKPKQMTFNVGEGLSAEQKLKAESVVRKEPSVKVGGEAPIKMTQGQALAIGLATADKRIQEKLAQEKPGLVEAAKEKDIQKMAFNRISDLAFGITSELQPVKKAGNILLEKITTQTDVENILKKVADDYKGKISEQTRGVITNQKTRELADALGMNPEKLMTTSKGTAFNAEELLAATDILKTSATNLSKLQQEIANGNNSDKMLLVFRDALDKHAELQKVISGVKAESGRALQANKIIAREIPEEEKAREAMLKAMGGRETNEELVKRFASIDPTDLQAVNKFIREATQATKWQKVYWVWLNSILSNPTTHIVNSTSNLARAMYEPVIKTGEIALEKLAKGKESQRYWGEVGQEIIGNLKGFAEGVRKAVYVLKEGITPEQAVKIDIPQNYIQPIKGKTGAAIGMPTRALTAEDEFFKAVNGTGELYSQSYKMASDLGLKGKERLEKMADLVNNPTPEILEAVEKTQLETTFQQPLGKYTKELMRFRNNIPGLKYIIPFLKTPTNIVKESVAMSPLGFLETGIRAAKGENISRPLAKNLIGSAIATWTASKVLEGDITGAAPKNEAERDTFYRSGKQAYSIRVGDNWYSYRRIEPLATMMGLVADGINEYKSEEDLIQTGQNVAALIGRNLNDKTFMSGLSNVINAISDPERYGQNWLAQGVSGLVPFSGLQSYVAQLNDSVIRNPKGIKAKIESRTPFLSENVIPKRNVWGESIKREGSTLERAVSPINRSSVKNDPTDAELINVGIDISFPSNKITIPKDVRDQIGIKDEDKQITLNNEEFDKFLYYSGQELKMTLDKLFSSPDYKNLSVEEKEETINKVIDAVRQKHKYLFLINYFNEK